MQKFTDENITLIESIHKYELKDDPEFEFTSCTEFAKYFFEPFDKIGIANSLTATHPNYADISPQKLVEEWDAIAVEGTLIHSEIENYIKDNAEPTHPKSKSAVEWLTRNILANDRYDIFSEVIVYSKELELAGTIDILLFDKQEDTYKLLDWKTNKRIDSTSFQNKMGTHKATCELMDCNYYHYSIQLSLYRLILEKYYGISVTGTAISHITENDVQIYKTTYHLAEIEKMLKADRAALRKKAKDSLTKEFVQ
jgi:ATP-dependent exoDNAse (exonuclease V) beta subunit